MRAPVARTGVQTRAVVWSEAHRANGPGWGFVSWGEIACYCVSKGKLLEGFKLVGIMCFVVQEPPGCSSVSECRGCRGDGVYGGHCGREDKGRVTGMAMNCGFRRSLEAENATRAGGLGVWVREGGGGKSGAWASVEQWGTCPTV